MHGFLPRLAFMQFGCEKEQYLLTALLRLGDVGIHQAL